MLHLPLLLWLWCSIFACRILTALSHVGWLCLELYIDMPLLRKLKANHSLRCPVISWKIPRIGAWDWAGSLNVACYGRLLSISRWRQTRTRPGCSGCFFTRFFRSIFSYNWIQVLFSFETYSFCWLIQEVHFFLSFLKVVHHIKLYSVFHAPSTFSLHVWLIYFSWKDSFSNVVTYGSYMIHGKLRQEDHW